MADKARSQADLLGAIAQLAKAEKAGKDTAELEREVGRISFALAKSRGDLNGVRNRKRRERRYLAL